MDISKDFYQILEVSEDASDEEIKNSYRRLAKKYHPDASTSTDEHMFQLIQSAWDILGNPERRMDYDKKVKKENWETVRNEKLNNFQNNAATAGSVRPLSKDSWSYPKIKAEMDLATPSFVDRLKTIASGGKGQESITKITKRALLKQHHPEQSAIVKITPFELWFGTKKELEIKSLGGLRKIKIKIPKGFVLGSVLNINCPQTEDYPEQSVKINIQLEQHASVRIDGLDLTIDLPISYSEAILGDEIVIPTPLSKLKLKIPARFEVGKKIKVAANGIEENGKIGDLYIRPFIAELPDNEMLIKILAKLDQLYGTDIRSDILSELTLLRTDN